MPTITLPQADLTSAEIAELLRTGLGDHFHVQPGMRVPRRPLAKPQAAAPNSIVVGTGSNRLFHAQLTITHRSSSTDVLLRPGGLGWETIVNSVRIVPKIRKILLAAI
jgi:hypothetical protein